MNVCELLVNQSPSQWCAFEPKGLKPFISETPPRLISLLT
jgi:hypothetical protein